MNTETVADLLRNSTPAMLERVTASVRADDLRKGVDLLRTRPNEVTLVQGRIQTYQIWQRLELTSDPPTLDQVVLHVDSDLVLVVKASRGRLDRMRLVKPGTVLRAFARDAGAKETTLITLQIFGWEVRSSDVPYVEPALTRLASS